MVKDLRRPNPCQAKKIDEELFEQCWNMARPQCMFMQDAAMLRGQSKDPLARSWLVLKRVPEYRFDAELQNVQE